MANILSFLQTEFLLAKIGILLFLIAYIVFAVVVLNQIRVMNRIISLSRSSALLEFLGLLNILISGFLFILSLVIL